MNWYTRHKVYKLLEYRTFFRMAKDAKLIKIASGNEPIKTAMNGPGDEVISQDHSIPETILQRRLDALHSLG